MVNTPDITPESRMLRLEYDELKKKFTDLMLTFEDMKQHLGPKISALYLNLLGNKKYEILNLQVEIKTLEMRKQLLQSYINRDQTPDLKTISKQIQETVETYNQMLENEAQKLKDAKTLLEAPVLNPEDTAEAKSLYRMLVKHLHPDANPDLTDKEKDLFLVVQTAYSVGDLEKLREICLTLDSGKIINTDTCTANLSEYINKLKNKISGLEQKIADLNKMFPFNLKDKITDKNWVQEEQQKDNETVAQLTEKRNNLSKIIAVMEEYKTVKK